MKVGFCLMVAVVDSLYNLWLKYFIAISLKTNQFIDIFRLAKKTILKINM